MSPLEHIFCIIHCYDEGEADDTNKVEQLANQFYNLCLQLADDELLMLDYNEELDLNEMIDAVIQCFRIDTSWTDRWKVLGAILRIGCADNIRRYMKDLEIEGFSVYKITNWNPVPGPQPFEPSNLETRLIYMVTYALSHVK